MRKMDISSWICRVRHIKRKQVNSGTSRRLRYTFSPLYRLRLRLLLKAALNHCFGPEVVFRRKWSCDKGMKINADRWEVLKLKVYIQWVIKYNSRCTTVIISNRKRGPRGGFVLWKSANPTMIMGVKAQWLRMYFFPAYDQANLFC